MRSLHLTRTVVRRSASVSIRRALASSATIRATISVQPFAIVLDDEVISAPVIQSHIPGGSGIITGNFSVEESTNLAILLRAGALPAELIFLEERTIGPELGQDSIDAGKVATIVAFAAVLVFMALSYGLFGIFANIALIINVGLLFGLLVPDRGHADPARYRGDRSDSWYGGGRQRADL